MQNDAAKDTLTLTTAQVEALKRVKQHWEKIPTLKEVFRVGIFTCTDSRRFSSNMLDPDLYSSQRC